MFKSTTTFSPKGSDNYIKVDGRLLKAAADDLVQTIEGIKARKIEENKEQQKSNKHLFEIMIPDLKSEAFFEHALVKCYIPNAKRQGFDKPKKAGIFKKAVLEEFTFTDILDYNWVGDLVPEIYRETGCFCFGACYSLHKERLTYSDLTNTNNGRIKELHEKWVDTLYFNKVNPDLTVENNALLEIEPFRNITGRTVFMNMYDYNRIYKKGMISVEENKSEE